MTIFPLIIDSQPAYLRGASGGSSLLLAECGFDLVIDRLRSAVRRITAQPLAVATRFDPDAAYRTRLSAHGVKDDSIIAVSGIERLLARFEPSDWLLILDASTMPADFDDLERLTDDRSEDFAARHLVYLERTSVAPREYVQLDADRAVRRIQRYYPGITWLQARTVVASLAPVSATQLVGNAAFGGPAELRTALVGIGLVSNDIHAPGGALDLREEHGLLQLCGRTLESMSDGDEQRGFECVRPNVWAAQGCRIDASVRFHGPVVMHAGAAIERNATVIGPTMLGASSRVGRGAAVVRSIVLANARVSESAAVRHEVLGGAHGRNRTDGPGKIDRDAGGRIWLPAIPPDAASAGAPIRRRRAGYAAVKALFEGVVALFGLLLISPILLVAAIAVKATSRGPIFFCHDREGLYGRAFRCWKFRTMVKDAHSKQRELYKTNNVDGPQFKMDRDPRITRIGGLLRSTNIDELPQLFNVVLGQMSLIGPRPSPFRENQICVPWRQARLSVRPGITGLWQICRHERESGDFHQWIYFDMLYVRHMSFWLDVKILLATVFTMGGRWSVPLTWIIPADRLEENYAGVSHEHPPNADADVATREAASAVQPERDGKKQVEEAA